MNRKERRLKLLQHCKSLIEAKVAYEMKKKALKELPKFVENFPSHDVKASGIFHSVYAKY